MPQTLPPARPAPLGSYGVANGVPNCSQGPAPNNCPTPPLTRATRSFENYACDQSATVAAAAGYQGYGEVLDDINFAVPFARPAWTVTPGTDGVTGVRSAAITCITALINARWVNACGKLPR